MRYIDNIDNIIYNNTDNELQPYNIPENDIIIYHNNSNNNTNILIYNNIITYWKLFGLTLFSLGCVYGFKCYNKFKYDRMDDEIVTPINIENLNTLIVCNELPENNCSICLDEFKNEDILKKLNCSHIFHKDCLVPWINNNKSCPLCRTDIL
tara:strand:+ start:1266 stop:1721 length:456 start_codon:yes stop_codon:yes gene_type:complete